MIDPLDLEIGEGGDGTDVSLTEVLEQTMVRALQSMAGPVIGKVDVYDAASGRVSITPLVPLQVDGEMIPAPKLPSVPVCWPRTTTHAYTLPVAAGSYMELVPLGHDHSRWITAGTENQPPADERRFSLADLVALPLVPSPLSAPPDPLSYDPTNAVLFGPHKCGSSAATKAVGLHGDLCPVAALMATWMGQVEVICNAVPTPPAVPVFPLSSTFNSVSIATLAATAAKLKAE